MVSIVLGHVRMLVNANKESLSHEGNRRSERIVR